ncbi:TetR/AcrR family transcriptional regulator [Euzebya rosea]|uniref:TetR/AcrR family transcriptional regulator n=1 Tax=Euzebya rosea TaxID=2052804 RepID=UPI001474D0EE|nr:TetR/AcrR family transcriptional regulator [Euzebya rosea]
MPGPSAAGRRPDTGTRGDRTRAAVVAAARDRFAADGFERATGARIAADAGVSEPTIAFHFGSKAGLLVAVMQDYYDDLLQHMDAVIDSADAPLDRLTAFARWWMPHTAAHQPLMAVFGRQGRRTTSDEVVEAFRACNRRVTRVVDRLLDDLVHTGVMRPDVPTRVVRDAFFGTTEHLLLGHAATGRPDDLVAAADDVIDLLLNGAGSRTDPTPGPPPAPPGLAEIDAKLDRVLARLDPPDGRA